MYVMINVQVLFGVVNTSWRSKPLYDGLYQ